jgi:hypothetical protein
MKDDRRTRPQVTLEDLLRLKRAERPPAAFWADFDREMRVKQLAAIVETRPWWAPLIRINARLSRYQLPVGATAILALTLVTVREYRLPGGEPALVLGAQVVQLDAIPGPAPSLPVDPTADLSTETAAAVVATKGGPDSAVTVTDSARTLEAMPGNISQWVSMLGGAERLASEQTPSARSIAANLAAVKASEPELAKFIDQVTGIESRSSPTRLPAVDPLARMQSPSDARRARVLSTALPAVAYAAADTGERRYEPRLHRDLTDERLYERVSRFDLESERLAINIRL